MGITKTEGFTSEINEMADIFKAIGHPARLRIIEYLAESPSCICNDLVGELPLAQPTISRHLSELKKVGIIKGTIEGKNVCYCINEDSLDKIKSLIDKLNGLSIANKQCC